MATARPNVLTFSQDDDGFFRWTLKAPNGVIIGASTQPYNSKAAAYYNVAQLFSADLEAGNHLISNQRDHFLVLAQVTKRASSNV